MPQLHDVLFSVVVEVDAPPDGVDLHFGHVYGREEVLEHGFVYWWMYISISLSLYFLTEIVT